MSSPTILTGENPYKLFVFSFLLAIITYGFALTNFTLTVDNEIPILPNYGLDLGRWGHNLILYHLLGGHFQYFSLILSLFLYSVSAVKISNLFKFNNYAAYFFCALFITFPQISYQVVFGMMSVIAGLGVLLSTICVELFLKTIEEKSFFKRIMLFSLIGVILMFNLSLYQAFILIPVVLYLILFFQKIFEENFNLNFEIKKGLLLFLIIIISGILYYLSVKIICPIQQGGYIDSFVNGGSADNQFLNFCSIWLKNLVGNFYYGSFTFIIATLASISLFVMFFIKKENTFIRFLTLLVILLMPFLMSSIITNGYHPPRLYLTSNIVFAFIIVFTLNYFKLNLFNITKVGITLILITHFYFVSHLFYSANKIYKHDKKIAEKIDYIIQNKYPNFSSTEKQIYFYGSFHYDYHQKFRLKNSEIFGGSIYSWDNGSNYRIINFFKEADVAEYNMITKEKFDLAKDSISKMPIWPNPESIKIINEAVIVKLGGEKGSPLYFE
jgi:hypothetical protein